MGAEARRSLYEYCRLNQKQYLLDEWDDGRNLPLTPQTITYGSKRAAWWRCANGHTWRAVLYTRTGGARCPYCTGRRVQPGFNDLASVHPELARQWDYAKNAPLVPADISAGSGRSVWWRCEKGHSWRALIRSRTAGCGCPVCAGRQLLPAKTTSRRSVRSLQSSGTLRETGISARRTCCRGRRKKSGGYANAATTGAQQSRCAHAA